MLKCERCKFIAHRSSFNVKSSKFHTKKQKKSQNQNRDSEESFYDGVHIFEVIFKLCFGVLRWNAKRNSKKQHDRNECKKKKYMKQSKMNEITV